METLSKHQVTASQANEMNGWGLVRSATSAVLRHHEPGQVTAWSFSSADEHLLIPYVLWWLEGVNSLGFASF